MNFGDLKSELRPLCWPEGESENLLAVHDAFFNEAIYDLVKFVPCFSYPHSDVYEHCATYFSCGMTVLPKPAGAITRLYVIDRIDPETGLEDPDADEDHCTKVEYHQVSFEQLQRYVHVCERCNASPAVADELLTSIFGIFRRKRRYPRPTDEGFEDQPPLPPGFHYPQASTDASGRSPGGVWAIHRGRVYISPWIQSTESVVVEWVGLKSKWGDADTVDDDIKFKQAMRLHVLMQHESAYGEASRAADLHDQFYGNNSRGIPGALPTLIHECKEQTRLRATGAENSSASASAAQGLGKLLGQFFNDIAAQYTATCPSGQTGSVTANVLVGSVPSNISVADANAKAQAKAQADAIAKLVCEDAEVVFLNTVQSATAFCPAASGNNPAATGTPVTKTTAAGKYSSSVSQQAADDAAYAAALRLAELERDATGACTYHNAAASFTANCTPPLVGASTVTIPASQSAYDSTISQADANEKAKIAAENQARAALECYEEDEPVSVACNDAKSATHTATCGGGNCPFVALTGSGSVAPCEFTTPCSSGIVSDCPQKKSQMNQRAASEASRRAKQDWCQKCKSRLLGCFPPGSVIVVPSCPQ